jgi:hypothetical protein
MWCQTPSPFYRKGSFAWWNALGRSKSLENVVLAVAEKQGRKKIMFRAFKLDRNQRLIGQTFPPNQHDHIASGWSMSPEGSVARRVVVSDDTISTTVSGFAGAATCKRYA